MTKTKDEPIATFAPGTDPIIVAGFVLFPKLLFQATDISAEAKLCYAVVLERNQREAMISDDILASAMGVDESKIRRVIAELTLGGYLIREHGYPFAVIPDRFYSSRR